MLAPKSRLIFNDKSIYFFYPSIDVVTCVALDNCGSYLVTGSKDCTCIIWSLNNASVKATSSNTVSNQSPSSSMIGHHHSVHHPHQMNIAINSNSFSNVPKPIHTLYGHDDEVSCVEIMTELDLVVSGSKVSFFFINLKFVITRLNSIH